MAQDPLDPMNYEWSLANENYLDQDLIPDVQLQVGDTCSFHALAYGAQTQLRRHRWSKRRRSDVTFHAHSFSTDYVRQLMVRLGYDRVNRVETALQLFRNQGIFALSKDWFGPKRFPLSGYERHRYEKYQDVFNIIGTGYALIGIFPVRENFRDLKNEIYELRPAQSADNPISGYHMVMFMGFGMKRGRPYLLFLNSYGAKFGTYGIGRIYFDQVCHDHFYTLVVDEAGAAVASSSGGPAPPPGGPPPFGSAGGQPPAGGAPRGSAPRCGGDNRSKKRRLNNTSAASGERSVQSQLMGIACGICGRAWDTQEKENSDIGKILEGQGLHRPDLQGRIADLA